MLLISSGDYVGDGSFKVSDSGKDLIFVIRATIDSDDGYCIIEGDWKHYSDCFNVRKMKLKVHFYKPESQPVDIMLAMVNIGNVSLSGSFITRDGISCGLLRQEYTSRPLSLNLRVFAESMDVTGIWEGKDTVYFHLQLKMYNPLNVQSNVVSIG